ncbi:kinase-like protein [Neoconidiobolus thromboides FSU 785]|nr:kinase-like protein [Neoconidiobolus thromboides FSU 785]
MTNKNLLGFENFENSDICLYPGQTIGDKKEGICFMIIQHIGIGTISKCYSAIDLVTGNKICLKVYDKQDINKHYISRLENEIMIQKKLNNSTIVNLYGHFEDANSIYLVLELCENQTLRDYLELYTLNEDQIRVILYQISNALRHCHSKGVIYRDLKADHVFLDHNFNCKLGDFSEAILVTNGSREYSTVGNYHYIAPEVVDNLIGYDYKADSWSFGVLAFYLFTNTYPFDNDETDLHIRRIIIEDYIVPNNKAIYSDAKHVIQGLLKREPADRFSLSEALKCAFFSKYEKQLDELKNGMSPLSNLQKKKRKKKNNEDGFEPVLPRTDAINKLNERSVFDLSQDTKEGLARDYSVIQTTPKQKLLKKFKSLAEFIYVKDKK